MYTDVREAFTNIKSKIFYASNPYHIHKKKIHDKRKTSFKLCVTVYPAPSYKYVHVSLALNKFAINEFI